MRWILVVGLAVALGAASCWFCGNPGPQPPPYDPKPGDPFVVDVHAHVINGQDVPLYGFVRYVYLQDNLALGVVEDVVIHLLEDAVRAAAPGYAEEVLELCGQIRKSGKPLPPLCLAPAPSTRTGPPLKRPASLPANPTGVTLDTARTFIRGQLQNQTLRKAVIRTLQNASVRPVRASGGKRLLRPAAAPAQDASAEAATESFLQMFGDLIRDFSSWRLNNVYALEWLYPDVGLFVGQLLDYDAWLGETSPVTPAQQNTLATLLAIATDGRLATFVAFDPWRDAATSGAALAAVKDAVLNGGAVGVKVYPPIGFRLWGNAGHPMVGAAGNAGPSGDAIDASLGALYDWCAQYDVPILVHTGASNYAGAAAKDDADPAAWDAALAAHPGTVDRRLLRVNQGHFGGQTEPESPAWRATAIDQFGRYPNFYADVSCFDPQRDGASGYWSALATDLAAHPIIARRLMYGSDWFLLTDCAVPSTFESTMRATLANVLGDTAARDVLGNNAVAFLGLASGACTRRRLDAFYARAGVTARWRSVVDGLVRIPATCAAPPAHP